MNIQTRPLLQNPALAKSLAVVFSFIIHVQVFAADVTISVTGHNKNTKVDKAIVLTVTPEGGPKQDVNVVVPKTAKPDLEQRRKDKAVLIRNTLVSKGFDAKLDPNDDTKVDVKGVEAIAKRQDTTGETETFTINGHGPARGEIGFAGPVTGLDFEGNPGAASYAAAFGFYDSLTGSDVLASSEVLFTELTSPTVDELLNLTFLGLQSQLPLALQSSLSLDLGVGIISFDFPAYSSNPFVEVGSEDPELATYQSIHAPDASNSAGLFAIALIGLFALRSKTHWFDAPIENLDQ